MTALPQAVQQALEAVRRAPVAERLVVFDADGTLWRGDVGEALLHELISLKWVDVTFAQYQAIHDAHPLKAYAWAVEIMKGLGNAQLQQVCQQLFERDFVTQIFGFVTPLLEALNGLSARTYVCSASPWWPVQAGARVLGIDGLHVIAVEGAMVDGVLTGEVLPPVTAGLGKVKALRMRKLKPVLAVGNGALDLPMLEFSQQQLVVSPRDAEPNELVLAARARQWPIVEV